MPQKQQWRRVGSWKVLYKEQDGCWVRPRKQKPASARYQKSKWRTGPSPAKRSLSHWQRQMWGYVPADQRFIDQIQSLQALWFGYWTGPLPTQAEMDNWEQLGFKDLMQVVLQLPVDELEEK
jgi:hypothetical protein